MAMLQDIIMLAAAINPTAVIPIVLGETSGMKTRERIKFVTSECFIALIVLIIFGLFGSTLLSSIGITETSIRLGGSVILMFCAIDMIYGSSFSSDGKSKVKKVAPFIVPVAIPMIVGPAAMSITIAIGSSGYNIWEVLSIISITWGITSTLLILASTLIGSSTEGQSSSGVTLAFVKIGGLLIAFIASSMFIAAVKSIAQSIMVELV